MKPITSITALVGTLALGVLSDLQAAEGHRFSNAPLLGLGGLLLARRRR